MSEAFTIYPPIPPCPNPSGLGYAYEDWFDDRGIERRLTAKKRLTDAELAAEVFSAVFHEAECEVRGRKLAAQYPAHPAIDQWAAHNHEFGRQADILRRFATLPNYDEPQP